MNLKYIFSISLLIISITTGFSQQNTDAVRLINEYIQTIQQETITADFILRVSEKNEVNSQSFSGKAILSADKFFLEMDDLMVWFDGKTQWTYMMNANEVTITDPDAEELAQTNPITIISAFRSVSNINFSKTKSNINHLIEFSPKTKKADFNKIVVALNKTNNQLAYLNIYYTNGVSNELKFTSYQQSKAVNAAVFMFDKTKAKGAFVNDLR